MEKQSLEQLLKEVQNSWVPWMGCLDDERKRLLKDMNNIEAWQKILKEKGELIMFCPVCALTETVKLELKQARERETSCVGKAG
jgi:hypothetical protein